MATDSTLPISSQHPFRAELDLLGRLIAFTEPDILSDQLSFKMHHCEAFYFLVIASWIKTLKTAKSIHLLCENCLSRDAEALLRVLIESLVNLLYLSKEQQNERARWYIGFLSLTNKKLDGALANSPKLRSIWKKISPDSRREIQRQYEEVMAERTGKPLPWYQRLISSLGLFPRLWRHAKTWSGKSTEVMAKSLGLEAFYDLAYRLASDVVHGSDLMHHLKYADESTLNITKGLEPVLNPDDSVARETLVAATLGFYLVLESVYETLEHPRLNDLKREFQQIEAQLRA